MIFDSHAHLISRDFDRYPTTPLSGIPLPPEQISSIVTAEELIELMDANDITRSLVVQRAHVYGFNNSYIVDSAEKYADRINGMCMVDGLNPETPEKVREWVKRGAIAIRMTEPHKGAGPEWFSSEQAIKVWEVAEELGVSVRLHFYGWNRDVCLPALIKLMERFTSVPTVVDHLSSPLPTLGTGGIDELLVQLSAFKNVSLLVSTINFRRIADAGHSTAAVLQRAIDVFGSDRIMWGSDIAQSAGDYKEMIALALEATSSLSDVDRENVLYNTGNKLYGADVKA